MREGVYKSCVTSSNNNRAVETSMDATSTKSPRAPEPEYHLTFVDSTLAPVSLFRQIWQRLHEPKTTILKEYYRGKAVLPATDMRPWFLDLPNQIRVIFEKPKPPSIPITSHPVVVPELWQDYQPQPSSWLNSLFVHLVGAAIILVPFFVGHNSLPVKTSTTYKLVDISPYVAELEAAGKKAGGGGGGGDRSPTPASKGAAPRFAKQQLAPPMAVIRNPHPILQVEPTLLGAPELKLPQMASNMPWGDPQGVPGPPSNGPGTGGGLGSGEGTGIGPGKGGGLGPGEGGGTGGGPFSVGGGISAPTPIYDPAPAYSEEARKAKYQGNVVVMIVVDAQGNVTDAHVVRPVGLGLDENAVEIVRTWKFRPAMRNGAPVSVRVGVEVFFRLL
jgi:TonB family protein